MPEKILWFFVWKMHTTRQKLKEQLRDCSYIPSGSDNSNRKRRGADRFKRYLGSRIWWHNRQHKEGGEGIQKVKLKSPL